MVKGRTTARPNEIAFRVGNTLIMTLVSIVTFYPFIYMLMLSFSGGDTFGRILLWPSGFTTVAYQIMINKLKFMDGMAVSAARSLLGPVLTIFIIYMGAYALSHQRLVFHKFFSRFVVFAMYFSAGLLPVYMNISNLRLSGTFWVYIIPYLVNVFELILIRTFIEDLPASLEESALIDGANELQVAFRIVFPLCLPVLAAVVLFEFVTQWNMYTDTLLYNAHKPEFFTLQYMLSNYLAKQLSFSPTDFVSKAQQQSLSMNSLRMAMTVVVCFPVVVVYPFLQKYFVKGILVGSIKG